MLRWIARFVVVAVVAAGLAVAMCVRDAKADTSISVGFDVLHAPGDLALFVRRDFSPEWGGYLVMASGNNDAFGVALDYSVHGWGALDGWTARLGAVGWNHTNSMNGTPLNFWIMAQRRINKNYDGGLLHTSAGAFLGLTEESNSGRNILFVSRRIKWLQ